MIDTPPQSHRPMRSVLYVPAVNQRAIQKARTLPVDALILDLEDAVIPERKDEARRTALAAVGTGGFGHRLVVIRVNGLDTPWGRDDLLACAEAPLDAVLLPKVGGTHVVEAARSSLPPDMAIWTMMETPAAILRAEAIAAAPDVAGLVIGTNDLASALGLPDVPDRAPLLQAIQFCLLAARAAGVPCIDGVHNAIDDREAFRTECLQGRMLGLDGKSLIHPAQIDLVNDVFSPTKAELDQARRRVDAFDRALAEGQGVAVLDGRIVEGLHVDMARRTLARWEAIRSMKGTG